jgi:ComF family protein
MIQRFKFNGSLPEGTVLGTLLAARIASAYAAGPVPGLIVPVPLHWRRLLTRGHNQSALVARVVGRTLGIPVAYRQLRRRRHTPAQSSLSRSARQRNLVGAFQVCGELPSTSVALVDDVMTTGATANAIARCLRAAGADEIHVWLLARTPGSTEGGRRARAS